MAERDDIERLRDEYARLAKHEPRAETDAAIRDAARRRMAPRRLGAWSAALAGAACIGLAIVLVPALLVDAPAPVAMQESAMRVASEEAEQKAREIHSERESAARRARPMVAAPAPRPAGEPEQYMASQDHAGARPEPRAALKAGQAPPVNPDALRTLREELRDADEATWRRRLLALRAAGREPLATALLEDFRQRFGRDADFTLDDLAAEAPPRK